MSATTFPLSVTEEQLQRVLRGDVITLAPAQEGHRLILSVIGDQVVIQDLACDADHCTPEERAVIEAAIGYEKAYQAAEWSKVQSYRVSDEPLRYAVQALLAARTKREERE